MKNRRQSITNTIVKQEKVIKKLLIKDIAPKKLHVNFKYNN